MITAIMILIVILLSAYRIGNGPLWQEIIYPSVSKCKDNWWAHALYISNFINGKNMVFIKVLAVETESFKYEHFF